MRDAIPVGRRFSHLYVERGEPIPDGQRMRLRLGESCPHENGLSDYLRRELGVVVRPRTAGYGGNCGVDISFFRDEALNDVLDTVTLVRRFLMGEGRAVAARAWVATVRRVFEEENVGYRIDDEGGVHFFVDQAFEAHRLATLASLNGPRYANTLAEFERAFRALDQIPPDGKLAVRSIFTALEALFRLMFPNAPRLGAREVTDHLTPFIARAYGNDLTAHRSANKLAASFREWVDGAHFYRHEQGQEEPAQPPETLAVQLVDQGTAFLRWLAELDATAPPAGQ